MQYVVVNFVLQLQCMLCNYFLTNILIILCVCVMCFGFLFKEDRTGVHTRDAKEGLIKAMHKTAEGRPTFILHEW